jgi:hypothetical protein
MSGKPIHETQEWLAQARIHIANSNLPAARDLLQRLLERLPEHPEALQLLAETNSLKRSSNSSLTAYFRIPQKELRAKLPEALNVISDTYDGLRRDIEETTAQTAPRHSIDNKIRIADVAAIKQSLSEGALDSAQLRLDIALLTFPGDVELKALELRLRNELPQTIAAKIPVEGRPARLQERWPPPNQTAAETVVENPLHATADVEAGSVIPVSERTDDGSAHAFSSSSERDLGTQARMRDLWKRHFRKIVAFAGVIGLIVVLGLVVRHARVQARPIQTKLAIDSSPKKARLFLNGILKGTTPYEGSWQIRRAENVSINVRLELENYEPFEKTIVLLANQDQTLTPVLKLTNLAAELERLFGLAQQAMERGDLTSPAESNAMAYLTQVKELDPAGQTQPGSRGADLQSQIKDQFKVRLSQLSPKQRGTQTELSLLETFKTALDPDDTEINSRIAALNELVERQKARIQTAIRAGILLSSQPQNALGLLSDLETKFPRERATLKPKREEIHGKVLEIARQKCLTQSAECLNFIDMASRDYPDDKELPSLRAGNKPPESQPRVATASPVPSIRPEVVELKTKLEEAYAAKRYVAPQSDSAVHYANEVLRYVPDDARASDLKQDSRIRAEKEVDQLMSGSPEKTAVSSQDEARRVFGNFQQASEILGGLASFWPGDAKIQRQFTDVKARAKDVQDFMAFKKAYPVTHSHAIGNCKGILTISPFGLTYVPETGSHGFDKQFKEIGDIRTKDGGESLEFKIEQRTMTFKYNKDKSNKDINRSATISAVQKDIQDIRQIRNQLEAK